MDENQQDDGNMNRMWVSMVPGVFKMGILNLETDIFMNVPYRNSRLRPEILFAITRTTWTVITTTTDQYPIRKMLPINSQFHTQ